MSTAHARARRTSDRSQFWRNVTGWMSKAVRASNNTRKKGNQDETRVSGVGPLIRRPLEHLSLGCGVRIVYDRAGINSG